MMPNEAAGVGMQARQWWCKASHGAPGEEVMVRCGRFNFEQRRHVRALVSMSYALS